MNPSSIQTNAKIFYDQSVARNYREADELAVTSETHEHLDAILKDLSGSFGHNISALELGCGTGRYFHCLQNVEKLVGVDLSSYMLEEARNPVKHENIGIGCIELRCGSIFELDVPRE